jgi:hypothetical protein
MQNDAQMLPRICPSRKIPREDSQNGGGRRDQPQYGPQGFAEVFKCDVDPEAYVKENGLAQVSDTGAIEPVIDQVLAANERRSASILPGTKRTFSS